MSTTLYYDNFTRKYVLNKETGVPPERYMEVDRGFQENNYSEIWEIRGKSNRLRLSYSQVDIDHEHVDVMRYDAGKRHNCQLVRMLRQIVPPSKFDDLLSIIYKEKESEETVSTSYYGNMPEDFQKAVDVIKKYCQFEGCHESNCSLCPYPLSLIRCGDRVEEEKQ